MIKKIGTVAQGCSPAALGLALAMTSCSTLARRDAGSGTPAVAGEGIHGVDPGSRVKGWVSLTTGTSAAGAASVQYFLNGRALSRPIAGAPYTYRWFSGSVLDGPDVLSAVVFDKGGQALAGPASVSFQVANGDATIASTLDPSKPLSGSLSWNVTATRLVSQEELDEDTRAGSNKKPYEAVVFGVDGAIAAVNSGSPAVTAAGPASVSSALALDTTRYPNGPHELIATAYASAKGIPPTGMVQYTVTFQNGHALMDVRPDWRDVFLAPGESQQVGVHALYTDGQSGPIAGALKCESADPHVATIDPGGRVTGVASGVTTVTLAAMGKTATARVVVGAAHGIPHFSRDGKVLTEYDPKRSLFVRAPFGLEAHTAGRSPDFEAALRGAAVNTLTTGFYPNPADVGVRDLATWRKKFESLFGQQVAFAKSHGYQLILTGDDIARTARELTDSVTNPLSREAIQLAFTAARDSGVVVGVEMVDESSHWGPSPRQPKGVPEDTFAKLLAIINGVPGRPSITWPVLGIASPDVAHNWMGDPAFSDYATQYWDTKDYRRIYPGNVASIPQEIGGLNGGVLARYPLMQRDKPQFMLASIAGPFYVKRGPGGQYVPGQDDLTQGGVPASQISMVDMYAAIMGMSGVRAYFVDGGAMDGPATRAKAPIGGVPQTGADPLVTGTDRWQAMSAAFNLIDHLTPYLFQQPISAEDLGAQFVTGARRGPRGILFMALNGSESPSTVNVNLAPYRAGSASVVRYRIAGATVSTARLAPSDTDTVTFAPGETAVWLFSAPGAPEASAPSLRFVEPMPDLTVSGGEVDITLDDSGGPPPSKVEIYADGKLLGTAQGAPLTFRWNTTGVSTDVWHGLHAIASTPAGLTSDAMTMVRLEPPKTGGASP